MADKLAEQIVAALTCAAADPAGVPLYKSKADAGLFPPTAAGRPAAERALADGLLTLTPAGAKPGKERAVVTAKGLDYLAEAGNPKVVLSDLIRAVERREADVAAVAAEVARLADALAGVKAAVRAVLPRTTPPLAGPVLARLADWSASAAAGEDCPLPELFRSLSTLEVVPTVGAFHDCLRGLHAAGRVYLHPWTGPLYALPEPEYALLSGHNVAYYASGRG